MCYILCMTKPSVLHCTVCGGVTGGCTGVRGPPIFFFGGFLHLFLAVFWHMVFVDGFLIPG
jgi:hypothetical protein